MALKKISQFSKEELQKLAITLLLGGSQTDNFSPENVEYDFETGECRATRNS